MKAIGEEIIIKHDTGYMSGANWVRITQQQKTTKTSRQKKRKKRKKKDER